MQLTHKRILLGVCGSIAAYKSIEILRQLRSQGADVKVVMTPSAQYFVGQESFAALSGQAVLSSMWNTPEGGEAHVTWGAWADLMLIAPATMHSLTALAQGRVDNALLACAFCCPAPLVVAPAMHHRMWNQPATQHALQILKQNNVIVIGPEHGALANGDQGVGRMSEPTTIVEALHQHPSIKALPSSADLSGIRVVITAGPTHEAIDPVRFIGDRSGGRMG